MKRIVLMHGSLGHTAKVFRNPEFDEYQVKFYNPEGIKYPDADYFTDDKEDALCTARKALETYKLAD